MEKNFWLNKWIDNQIGFHRDEYNPNLIKFWSPFTKESKGTVFVPLCGKSRDMIFFKNCGHKVYGVELSRIAVENFYAENKIPYKKDANLYYTSDFFLYCDDLFALKKEHFRDVEFIYDRASIVALPEDLRLKYVKWMQEIFPQASMFIETFDFGNTEVGPPFSVTEKMIHDYYSHSYDIRLIQTEQLHAGVHEDKVNSYKALTFVLSPK